MVVKALMTQECEDTNAGYGLGTADLIKPAFLPKLITARSQQLRAAVLNRLPQHVDLVCIAVVYLFYLSRETSSHADLRYTAPAELLVTRC